MKTDAYPAIDVHWMLRALDLARRGLYTADPNPRVGCVLTRDGRVIGEGFHARAGESHAEVEALRSVAGSAAGATAYVTLEPCAHQGRTGPCAQALIEAGVVRVVAAMEDPNPPVAGKGLAQLRAADIVAEVGLLEDKARALNPGFLSRVERGRPFLRLKSAMSLDGRTALNNGDSKWITGEAARADVQRYRARSAAIVTGIGTVLSDDPRMTARVDEPVTAPAVVVVDSTFRCPVDAQIFASPGDKLIIGREPPEAEAAQRAARLLARGAQIWRVAAAQKGLDLHAVVEHLNAQQMNEVLVEAGATLGGAFLQSGLVDEWVVYVAPSVLGPDARALVNTSALDDMLARQNFVRTGCEQIGPDVKLTFLPAAV
ncbi:MAG: bifunctional diaminohydroxyphosphoribosylaminopyrimidine deaminase/5-amino-6-(5-phosphoribosylamino)uracil reductase RibD [Gammaproteobacteria bacterium]